MNYDKQKYITSGRNIGAIKNEKGFTRYLVGNGIMQYSLNKVEYIMWKQINAYPTIEQWHKKMLEKLGESSVNIDEVFQKFNALNIISKWGFDKFEDPMLMKLYVSRNGFSQGLVNGKWILTDYDMKKSIELSKEHYYVWRAGTGSKMLLEVIANIYETLNVDEYEALNLLNEYGYKNIELGLWNVEYLDLESNGE